eukprot:tig00021036_g17333.t1
MTFYGNRLWLWGGRQNWRRKYDSADQSCQGKHVKGVYFGQDADIEAPTTKYRLNSMIAFDVTTGKWEEKPEFADTGSCVAEARVEAPACERIGSKWYMHGGDGFIPSRPVVKINNPPTTLQSVTEPQEANLLVVDLEPTTNGRSRPVDLGRVGRPTWGHSMVSCKNRLVIFSNDSVVYVVAPFDNPRPSRPSFRNYPEAEAKAAAKAWQPDLTKRAPNVHKLEYYAPPRHQPKKVSASFSIAASVDKKDVKGGCSVHFVNGYLDGRKSPSADVFTVDITVPTGGPPGSPRPFGGRVLGRGVQSGLGPEGLKVEWDPPVDPLGPITKYSVIATRTTDREGRQARNDPPPTTIDVDKDTFQATIPPSAFLFGAYWRIEVAAHYEDGSAILCDRPYMTLFGPGPRKLWPETWGNIRFIIHAFQPASQSVLARRRSLRQAEQAGSTLLAAVNEGSSSSSEVIAKKSTSIIYHAESDANANVDCEVATSEADLKEIREAFADTIGMPEERVVVINATCEYYTDVTDDFVARRNRLRRRLRQEDPEGREEGSPEPADPQLPAIVVIQLGVDTEGLSRLEIAEAITAIDDLAIAGVELGLFALDPNYSGLDQIPPGFDSATGENWATAGQLASFTYSAPALRSASPAPARPASGSLQLIASILLSFAVCLAYGRGLFGL